MLHIKSVIGVISIIGIVAFVAFAYDDLWGQLSCGLNNKSVTYSTIQFSETSRNLLPIKIGNTDHTHIGKRIYGNTSQSVPQIASQEYSGTVHEIADRSNATLLKEQRTTGSYSSEKNKGVHFPNAFTGTSAGSLTRNNASNQNETALTPVGSGNAREMYTTTLSGVVSTMGTDTEDPFAEGGTIDPDNGYNAVPLGDGGACLFVFITLFALYKCGVFSVLVGILKKGVLRMLNYFS